MADGGRQAQRETAAAAREPQSHREQGPLLDASPPFRDIVCGVDGTRASAAAVAQAAALAGPGGHITLLAVTATRGSGRFRAASIGPSRVKRVLDRAARIADEAGVSCEMVADPHGPPADVLVAHAEEHDLLALGAPARSGLGAFGGGVAISTLRTFTTPLLLARSLPDGEEQQTPPTARIVIASDGGEGSDRLVALAARLIAAGATASVTLVHAQGAESRAHPHRIAAQRRVLGDALGDEASLLVQPGDACEAILDAARVQRATLAVLGSRRRAGLGSALGSVSRRTVHALACSVLVVPPEHLGLHWPQTAEP